MTALHLSLYFFLLLQIVTANDESGDNSTQPSNSSEVKQPSKISHANSVSRKPIRCRGRLRLTQSAELVSSFRNVHINMNGITIPDQFDARTKWPSCTSIRMIKTQNECGACWAYAAASVIEDRLCIVGGQNWEVPIEELLKCCDFCVRKDNYGANGCRGGSVDEVFHYWVSAGLAVNRKGETRSGEVETLQHFINETCNPNNMTNIAKVALRNMNKMYGMAWYKYRTNASKVSIDQVKTEIMFNGPMVGYFQSYEYIEEMSKPLVIKFNQSLVKSKEKPITHAVKIIGWDERQEVPVWVIANSWGTGWCDQGFCTIGLGKNELKIEEHGMIGGLPMNIRRSGLKVLHSSRSAGLKSVLVLILAILVHPFVR